MDPTPLSRILARLSQLPCVIAAPIQPPTVPPTRIPNQIRSFMFLLYHERNVHLFAVFSSYPKDMNPSSEDNFTNKFGNCPLSSELIGITTQLWKVNMTSRQGKEKRRKLTESP
jgi:hypothetical protein